MSMRYKDDLYECMNYLSGIEQKATTTEESETIAAFIRAIGGALNVIEFYEARESILRVQKGQAFIDALDTAWYQQVTAAANERFGIGFNDKGETAEDD